MAYTSDKEIQNLDVTPAPLDGTELVPIKQTGATVATFTTAQEIADLSTIINWSLLGNADTLPGTDFIGTTDNKGLMFKTNNIQSGYIDLTSNNVSLGVQTLRVNIFGADNTAIGHLCLYKNIDGSANTTLGSYSLIENTNGSNNTALGSSALQFNTIGSNNIALGYYAGKYNTTQSDQIFISSLSLSNYVEEQTKSAIYVQQNIVTTNQKIFLNGLMNLSYVPTHTDNADAIAGGLIAGNIYKINNAGTYTLAIVV